MVEKAAEEDPKEGGTKVIEDAQEMKETNGNSGQTEKEVEAGKEEVPLVAEDTITAMETTEDATTPVELAEDASMSEETTEGTTTPEESTEVISNAEESSEEVQARQIFQSQIAKENKTSGDEKISGEEVASEAKEYEPKEEESQESNKEDIEITEETEGYNIQDVKVVDEIIEEKDVETKEDPVATVDEPSEIEKTDNEQVAEEVSQTQSTNEETVLEEKEVSLEVESVSSDDEGFDDDKGVLVEASPGHLLALLDSLVSQVEGLREGPGPLGRKGKGLGRVGGSRARPSLRHLLPHSLAATIATLPSVLPARRPTNDFVPMEEKMGRLDQVSCHISAEVGVRNDIFMNGCVHIICQVSLWLGELLHLPGGRAVCHPDAAGGLLATVRQLLALHYPTLAMDGFAALMASPPVIYLTSDLGAPIVQHVCSKLTLPHSTIRLVDAAKDFTTLKQMVEGDRVAGKVALMCIGYIHPDIR